MVLLILDAQRQITSPALYQFDQFVASVCTLIRTARENGIEVIYVRHDDGPGTPLTRGTDGFEIYDAFAPQPTERLFDKSVNSAFRDTGLREYLQAKGETDVILAGLQTDYCMDATVKAGFEHGFCMIVPEGANSTFDNPYMTAEISVLYHNDFLWKNRYALCLSMEETLTRMKTKAL